MKYTKITRFDTANGPGIRLVLWVSGCEHHCKECHNPETWDPHSGQLFTKSTLITIVNSLADDYVSGLTISGGDPLLPSNRESILALVKAIKSFYPSKSIWLYTGYRYEQVKGHYILDYIDVLVDGPYVNSLKDISLPYCGSSNQRVIDVKASKYSDKVVLWKNNM